MRAPGAMLALALVLGSAACGASIPPPSDEWAAAHDDVGRAEAGGAAAVPQAKLHLQIAQEDLEKSRGLMNTDNRRAADLVSVARAEAQLALSLAKENQAEDQAQKAQDELTKAKGGAK